MPLKDAIATGREFRVSLTRLLIPCEPSKVIAVGLNYASDHVERSEGIIVNAAGRPVPADYLGVFAKFPSSLIRHGQDIVLPDDATKPVSCIPSPRGSVGCARLHVDVTALALAFVALLPCQAQKAVSSDASSPPPAAAADVHSIEAILHAKYDVMSGPAGPRDWNRFYSLFIPSGGRLIRTRRLAPDSTPYLNAVTPQEFAQQSDEFFSKNSFYEKSINLSINTFGAVTQVFSTYESRRAKDDPQPIARGIDAFQLFNDGKRWYIVDVWWDAERPGNPIPARYLPGMTTSPPARAETPAPGTSFRDCSTGCPEMVVVPHGRFTMGAPAGEEARANLPDQIRGHSVPQHVITIRDKFAIAKFDVTRDEYAQFVAETNRPDPDSCLTVSASADFIAANVNWHSPGFPQTGRDPVVCVSWDDAQAYVAWLTTKTGHVYRLPTEAEWEYAARAGTTTARYGSDDPAEICRYTNVADLDYSEQHPGDSDSTVNRGCRDGYAFTSPVGSFPPNQFGLYDMLGDVMDWTEDCWNANYSGAPPPDGTAWQSGNCGRRVVRGGSWDASLSVVRAANRRGIRTSTRITTFGFRVARTL